MSRIWWAALSAAGALACSGQASADIMRAVWSGDFDGYVDSDGVFSPPGTVYGDTISPQVHWTATFVYDTALAVMTLGELAGIPTSQLTWNAASGTPSPVLSAVYTLGGHNAQGVGGQATFAASNFTSFSSARTEGWSVGMAVGSDVGLFQITVNNFFGPADPAYTVSPTAPLSLSTFQFGSTFPHGGQPHVHLLDITRIGDSPIVAVPEPATWMTLLLGFLALGSALRRRRASSAI